MLAGKTFLITGIADAQSLAMYTAKEIIAMGGKVVCTALGVSEHHGNLSERAQAYLNKNFEDFQAAVHQELGPEVPTAVLDVTLEENVADFAKKLFDQGIRLDGLLHAIAMDKTIRNKKVKPLLEVTRDEFCDIGLFFNSHHTSFIASRCASARSLYLFHQLYRCREGDLSPVQKYEYCQSGSRAYYS